MLLNSFFHFTILVFYFFPLFPKTTRTLSDTQPYPNATRTLSDDDLKLSTNRKAPRTMGTQDATNVAAFRSVCCHFKTVVYCYFLKFIANASPELQKCQTILSTRYTFLSQVGWYYCTALTALVALQMKNKCKHKRDKFRKIKTQMVHTWYDLKKG